MRKRFKEWLEQADVRSELSSAYNSPSNGPDEVNHGQVQGKKGVLLDSLGGMETSTQE